CHRVAGRHHQVIRGQIEALDRHRKERQVVPVAALREPIEKARADAVALDDRAASTGNVDEGKDLRLRIEEAELLEDPLAAPQAGEPVVNEGDLHLAASRYTSTCSAADRSQRKSRARTRPFSESSARSAPFPSSTRCSSIRSAPASPRGKCNAAPPETSTKAG